MSYLFTDYPGTRSLKLLTDFADHNMTTNDSSIPDMLEKNLASVNGKFFFYKIFLHGWLLIIKHNVSAGLTAVEFKDATWVRYMWWVYIIGLIWSSEFILACQHTIISGAVAKWYFTKCVSYK